jgi:hypothetical protein
VYRIAVVDGGVGGDNGLLGAYDMASRRRHLHAIRVLFDPFNRRLGIESSARFADSSGNPG